MSFSRRYTPSCARWWTRWLKTKLRSTERRVCVSRICPLRSRLHGRGVRRCLRRGSQRARPQRSGRGPGRPPPRTRAPAVDPTLPRPGRCPGIPSGSSSQPRTGRWQGDRQASPSLRTSGAVASSGDRPGRVPASCGRPGPPARTPRAASRSVRRRRARHQRAAHLWNRSSRSPKWNDSPVPHRIPEAGQPGAGSQPRVRRVWQGGPGGTARGAEGPVRRLLPWQIETVARERAYAPRARHGSAHRTRRRTVGSPADA